MIGTYAAALAVCGVSLALGQATLALCGVRRWSWLAPSVGLALLCAICWAAVRLPGDGLASALLVLALTVAAVAFLAGRLEAGREALHAGLPVAVVALAAVSLPFLVEGHFGILGTGFNPDMSQHLLATDRLVEGASGQLLREGYPLGPHAIVAALDEGLGIGLVHGFTGLTIAIAVLAPLTALSAFADRPAPRRAIAALLVGLPYLVASYYAQGAFKETAQALLVLAFLLALRESGRAWQARPLRFVPAAVLAVGTVYVYSFPGLIWLIGIAAIWALMEQRSKRPSAGGVDEGVSGRVRPDAPSSPGPAARYAASLALIVFAISALPELGRMIDFHSFETFDPSGPGLGNLFGQISPFAALGIWPSGDFRVAPGDGAAPALAFYVGAAFAATVLVAGLIHAGRRHQHALLAGVATALVVYLAARIGGTPYTAAKALEVAAPALTLAIVLPLAAAERGAPMGKQRAPAGRVAPIALGAYALAAGACSLLALANAPVGPGSYSPALTGLRPLLGGDPTLVLVPERLLDERHGARYVAWELRGGRVCIQSAQAAGAALAPGIRYVVTEGRSAEAPYPVLTLRRRAGPYTVWERRDVRGGPDPCPRIALRQAAVTGE